MKNYPNKNILIIADTQMPYERKDYLKFCKKMQKKHKCGRVIHIGDIADCLNFSSYERDPSCPSIPDEIESLRKSFKTWAKVFPNVECVIGNHDRRIRRKLDQAGFSEYYLPLEKIFREILGLPKGWSIHDKIKVKTSRGPVYMLHGDERGSSVVAGSTARKMGASVVRGHFHTKAFTTYISTHHQLIFDMIVGCGIDPKSVAFKYNKKDIDRPIFACGVIIDGVPYIEPMNLGVKKFNKDSWK